jgi:hypothetical protein
MDITLRIELTSNEVLRNEEGSLCPALDRSKRGSMGSLSVGARNSIIQPSIHVPTQPDSHFSPFAHPTLLLVNEQISRLSDEHSMRSGQISIF